MNFVSAYRLEAASVFGISWKLSFAYIAGVGWGNRIFVCSVCPAAREDGTGVALAYGTGLAL